MQFGGILISGYLGAVQGRIWTQRQPGATTRRDSDGSAFPL